MPLFDVPGWSVKSTPVQEPSTHISKKRKRPTSDSSKLHAAEINLDKLVERLKGSSASLTGSRKSAKQATSTSPAKKPETNRKSKKADTEDRRRSISRPKPSKPVEKADVSSPRQLKKRKIRHAADEPISNKRAAVLREGNSSLTALQLGMKQSLDGARFR